MLLRGSAQDSGSLHELHHRYLQPLDVLHAHVEQRLRARHSRGPQTVVDATRSPIEGPGGGPCTFLRHSGKHVPSGAPASNLTGPNFTPSFPAYPSGHARFGGSLFQILRHIYGTDDIAFTFVSDEFNA